MRLNSKGFAISSIMYIILVMAILIIIVSLSLLNGRKLILDKLKSDVSNKVNQDITVSYKDTLKEIKIATQNYINDGHSLEDTGIDNVSVIDLKSNNYLLIEDSILEYYNLRNKYIIFQNNNFTYSFKLAIKEDNQIKEKFEITNIN